GKVAPGTMSARMRFLLRRALEDPGHVLPGVLDRVLGGPAALASDDVTGVPIRPVMLRGAGFVSAVTLLGFPQKPRQGGNVHLDAIHLGPPFRHPAMRAQRGGSDPPGETGLDLLQEPAVAVGILERRQ